MAETAREAMDRVARVMADRIADDADLRTADQLQPGNMVKAAGEWYAVAWYDADERLLHLTGGHPARFVYPVTDGERFVWHEGSF